jgi:hypothetical protein
VKVSPEPTWELQWHRAGGGRIVRVALTERVVYGLAAAFVAVAAIAVGGGLASGLDRIGARDALAASRVENRMLSTRQAALSDRLLGLDDEVEAREAERPPVEAEGGGTLSSPPRESRERGPGVPRARPLR